MNKPDRRSFAFEFKLEVVRRYVGGEATALELAREHDLSSPKLVESWARTYRRDGEDALRPKRKGRPVKPVDPSGPGELERLRAENLRLSAKVSYLEKLRALRGPGARVKTQVIAALKADYPLQVLLRIAGLARSTFFYHQARLARPDPHAALKTAITEAFEAARGRYGHRRIHTVLARDGWQVAKKTVLKLMNALGLVCKVRRPRRHRSWLGQPGTTAENLLDRQFRADAPDTKWVTDVTEFRIGDRKLYLQPVIDLFDRSVVAYACGPSPSLELTNASLREAIAALPAGAAPMVHTDQGFQYRHASWRTLLDDAGLTQSMSRRAACLDNAMAENFFGHLKEELFHHNTFDTVEEFTAALHDYIDWYNTTRISTTLKGLSPAEYRAQTLVA